MQCSNVKVNHSDQPVTALVICLDLLTDFMSMFKYSFGDVLLLTLSVISIPTILLWNAQIKTRQKIGLLLSLCLSVVMIIIGLVRCSLIPRVNAVQDVPYESFLLQLEGSIAVLMASVSVFRSLFASESSRAARKKPNMRWTARGIPWRREKRSPGESVLETNGLPSIPSATMTGLRTFIRGGPKPTSLRSEFDETPEDYPLTVKKPETLHTRDTSAGEEV